MQSPPENDDGRTLVAGDGAKILVFGGYNVDGRNAGVETRLAHRPRLCVCRLQRDWPELVRRSGYRAIGGVKSVFYEKYIVSAPSETIHSLIVTYPAALKARYDPIVARVAASFAGP